MMSEMTPQQFINEMSPLLMEFVKLENDMYATNCKAMEVLVKLQQLVALWNAQQKRSK